jgi:biotin operon repressor
LTQLPYLQSIREALSELESNLTDGIAAFGPWITPIPSAALVANATMQHLHWSNELGWVTAGIIESLGLTTVSTALTLWEFNAGKRKVDPSAPFPLAASLVGVYLVSTIGLTVLLDIQPELSRYAPALFPLLALVGAVNLALRAGHRRRLDAIIHERAEKKAERQSGRQSTVKSDEPELSSLPSNSAITAEMMKRVRAAKKAKQDSRIDNLLTLLQDNPELGVTDISRAMNVSRQTVYTDLEQLQKMGRVRKNGHGIEVLSR